MIHFDNVLYSVLGGVTMLAITKSFVGLRHHLSGRNQLVKYATFIKRQARNRREIESQLFKNENVYSIVMQGVDAAYIAVKGKEPSMTILYLGKDEDSQLFRSCLDHLDDPDKIYAIATRQVSAGAQDQENSESKEFSDDANKGRPEDTWFRFTQGRDVTDEKVDEAMIEQVISLAGARDKDVSQSGSCHISLKMRGQNGHDNIVVLPTSMMFRKIFKKECGTDDLTRFGPKELFGKILAIRQKMSGA